MSWNPKRALGFILAPFTGGMSLVASEASYQQEKAAKKQKKHKLQLSKPKKIQS